MKGFFLTFSLVFVFAAISLAQQENNFEIIGKAMSDGDLIDLIASNDFLFIASLKHNQTKITFIDIADPSHPQRLEPEFVLGDYYDFLLNDTLLFFSTSDGMVIFNVARPRSPSISAIIHDDHARGIMKKYGDLIASAFQNHIYLNDFSDINNPQHIADINCYQMVDDYAFYNNYLFVTESLYGFYSDCYLEVFDLSDLANPLLIYSSDITDSRRTVAIEIINHYMYLYQSTFQDISQFDGIYTYDISTPNAPRFIGNYFQDINIEITDLYNDRLYVGGNGQITILDVADPENPIISGAFSADVIRMFAADNNLYCRTWGGEALVLDINNPDSPQFICSYIPGADA